MFRRGKYGEGCYLVAALMIINIAMAVVTFISPELMDALGIYYSAVTGGERYRLFTAMFVHAGIAHLAGNMFALYALGCIVEQTYGHWGFIVIYLVSGLVGSLAVYRFSDPGVLTVGASGAIFGLMAAAIVKLIRTGDRSLLRGVMLNLIINISSTFTSENISISAHIGGLIGGFFIAGLVNSLKNEQ